MALRYVIFTVKIHGFLKFLSKFCVVISLAVSIFLFFFKFSFFSQGAGWGGGGGGWGYGNQMQGGYDNSKKP